MEIIINKYSKKGEEERHPRGGLAHNSHAEIFGISVHRGWARCSRIGPSTRGAG